MSLSNTFESYREQVREAWPMPDVVERDVRLPSRPQGGRSIKVCCPFHEDHAPSLAVYDDHAYCFACQKSWDVFAWVMERDNLSFLEALERLGKERGIPRPHWTPEDVQRARDAQAMPDVLGVAADYYTARQWVADGRQALDYAHSRGWADETIREAGLGYADGGLGAQLRSKGIDLELAKNAGLIREDGRDYFHDRLIYVYRRAGGRVVCLSGRALDLESEPPHLNLPGSKHIYLNTPALASGATSGPIVLCEGAADAVTLGGWGIAAAALSGLDASTADMALLTGSGARYLCLDADDPGRRRVAAFADVFGPLTRIVHLPDGATDPNAWAMAGATADEFKRLMADSSTWLELKIDAAAAVAGSERDSALREVFVLAGRLDLFALARYKKIVSDKLDIKAREFDRLLKAAAPPTPEPETESKLEVLDGRLPQVSPALDYVEGLGVVTVPALVQIDGKSRYRPFLVTSARETILIESAGPTHLGGRRVVLTSAPIALGPPRWEWGDVKRFAEGEPANAVETFRMVEELYGKYIDFREKHTSEVLALWVIGTYLYPVFEAFPYILATGPKVSGKTKTLDLTAKLAFNARHSSSLSSAALFRVIQATRSSVAIDEAERLANPKDPTGADLRLLLNAGYKRGAPALRYSVDTGQVEEFDVYGPKIVASIRGVEDVLESRCIVVNMLRTNHAKGNLIIRAEGEDWPEIRHRLYSFGLANFTEIRDIYLKDASISILSNRQNELWRPPLAIAAFLSRRPDGPADLLDKIVAFAEREAGESDGARLSERDEAMMLALRELAAAGVTEVRPQEVCDKMIAFLDASDQADLRSQWVGYGLKRLGFPRRRGQEGSLYTITVESVEDILSRYGMGGADESKFAPQNG